MAAPLRLTLIVKAVYAEAGKGASPASGAEPAPQGDANAASE